MHAYILTLNFVTINTSTLNGESGHQYPSTLAHRWPPATKISVRIVGSEAIIRNSSDAVMASAIFRNIFRGDVEIAKA